MNHDLPTAFRSARGVALGIITTVVIAACGANGTKVEVADSNPQKTSSSDRATGVTERAMATTLPDRLTEATFSPDLGPRGTVISVEGRCLFGHRRVENLSIYFARVVSHGEEPFGTHTTFEDIDDDGRFSVSITVPSGAPDDEYTLWLRCRVADFGTGTVQSLFTVAGGEFVPTTSTTTTPTTVPSTTLPPVTTTTLPPVTTTATVASVPATTAPTTAPELLPYTP